MRYVYVGGKHRQRMHIMKHTITGDMLMEALCGIDHRFNRSVNAPWSLGKGVCKNCLKELEKVH